MRNIGGDRRRLIGTLLGLAALSALAACDTVGSARGGGASSGLGSTFGSLFGSDDGGAAGTASAGGPSYANLDTPCPPVDVQPGTASWRVYERGKENDALSLRYQAALGDTARECSALGAEVAMRIGVVGRVLTGPKGGPGKVEVPLRIAVVDEDDKPVYSKLYRVPVEIRPGEGQSSFTHIEEGVMVPVTETRLKGWRVLIGFDEKATATPARRG